MPKKKTLLKRTLRMKNLRHAWKEVAENNGMPGVDNISIQRWRRNWEERLHNLAESVLNGSYQPGKLRVRYIPKKKPGEWRELRIPTVTDRVLQRALLQTCYPIFERRFLDSSCGYRPKRGLKQAVERILVIRTNDYRYILDADIDDFFNQVDHALLMKFLKKDLPDNSLLNLITSWLKVSRVKPEIASGIPMGSPFSPLLANIYLHRLDQGIQECGYESVRYADDLLVFTSTQAELEEAYQDVEVMLKRLKLIYEPSKTNLTSFEEGFEFVGVFFEGDSYEYIWQNKRIEVHGDEVDWLFSHYGPDYG